MVKPTQRNFHKILGQVTSEDEEVNMIERGVYLSRFPLFPCLSSVASPDLKHHEGGDHVCLIPLRTPAASLCPGCWPSCDQMKGTLGQLLRESRGAKKEGQRRPETFTKSKWWETSLLAQWLRIRLPMQGKRVSALVWEDPTCRGATKPVLHNY